MLACTQFINTGTKTIMQLTITIGPYLAREITIRVLVMEVNSRISSRVGMKEVPMKILRLDPDVTTMTTRVQMVTTTEVVMITEEVTIKLKIKATVIKDTKTKVTKTKNTKTKVIKTRDTTTRVIITKVTKPNTLASNLTIDLTKVNTRLLTNCLNHLSMFIRKDNRSNSSGLYPPLCRIPTSSNKEAVSRKKNPASKETALKACEFKMSC